MHRLLRIAVPLGMALCLLVVSCASSPQEQQEADAAQAIQQEIEVGKAALAKIAGTYGVIHDREATAYLTQYLQSLALYVERPSLQYRCVILASEQINAYSLPGGYICITLGALKAIREPGELAGILAHELGHINKSHILNHVKIQVRKDFWETLGRIIAGSRLVITGTINQINDQIAERLFLEGYAAPQEFEADAYAVTLLQLLDLDADPYVEFLTQLEKTAGNAEQANLDKTHPPLAQRVEAMQALTGDTGKPYPLTPEFQKFLELIANTRISS